jgi:ABC-type amino acid transport substrate-binding protein
MAFPLSIGTFLRPFNLRSVVVRLVLAAVLGNLALLNGRWVGAGELFPSDIRQIKDRGRIVIAQYRGVRRGFFDYDDAGKQPKEPFCVYEGRRLIGCDIYLAKTIARELGVRVELNRSARDFDSVCRLVASGRADIGISKLSATLPRAQYVRFTTPYAILHTGVLINRLFASRARTDTNTLALCNRPDTKIGILQKCSYVGFAARVFPEANLVFYPDFEKMLAALSSGEIQAIYSEQMLILQALHDNHSLALSFRLVPVPHLKDPIAVAVSPESPNLLAFIDLLLNLEVVRTEVASFLKLPAGGAR